MELDADERLVLRDCDEAIARRRCRGRLGRVRVREPERLAGRLDTRPAHPWHAASVEPDRTSRKKPEPGDAAVFLGLVECELEAEADAERRATGGRAVEERFVEAALAQARHCKTGGADARQDSEIRVAHLLGAVGA